MEGQVVREINIRKNIDLVQKDEIWLLKNRFPAGL
jgi:hypothetical protein